MVHTPSHLSLDGYSALPTIFLQRADRKIDTILTAAQCNAKSSSRGDGIGASTASMVSVLRHHHCVSCAGPAQVVVAVFGDRFHRRAKNTHTTNRRNHQNPCPQGYTSHLQGLIGERKILLPDVWSVPERAKGGFEPISSGRPRRSAYGDRLRHAAVEPEGCRGSSFARFFFSSFFFMIFLSDWLRGGIVW